MKEIILKMDSPKEAAQFAAVLFKSGFNPYRAHIYYDTTRPLPVKIKKLTDYPLILDGFLNGHRMRVAITPLAIGSFSDGSCALRQILKAANFYFEEKDLFTQRKMNPATGIINFAILQR